MNRTVKRLAIPIGVAAVLGTTGFAFMASNSVAQSNAGQGIGTVAGYTVTDVHYPTQAYLNMDSTEGNPINGVTSVSFQLTPDNAGFVAVDFFDKNGTEIGGSGGPNNCTEDTTTHVWTCTNFDMASASYSKYEPFHAIPSTDIAKVEVEAIQTN